MIQQMVNLDHLLIVTELMEGEIKAIRSQITQKRKELYAPSVTVYKLDSNSAGKTRSNPRATPYEQETSFAFSGSDCSGFASFFRLSVI